MMSSAMRTGTEPKYSCKQRYRGQARERPIGQRRAGIIEWQKHTLKTDEHTLKKNDRFRSTEFKN